MPNFYFIQLIGVLLTGLGMVALAASSYLYGKPLSGDERIRTGERRTNVRRLPINLETVVSAAFFLGGMGILSWSKFDLCNFLAYWLPDLPDTIRFLFSCT
jgi:hypothetical protein